MEDSKLYQHPYHQGSLASYRFLITGGAGFIGSNLVEYLMRYDAGHVRVLDNLSTGYLSNIEAYLHLPNFEFIEGDIRDPETCREAVSGVHFVSHHAALGSVPRSVSDPLLTNEVNISGFLNILNAVKENAEVRRMVFAASSSTYGDSEELPKKEGNEGSPLSPYAVTKAVNEMYAAVFSRVYGLHTIGLRYFNVFGPRQSADHSYAAVIPLFCKAFIESAPLYINGDGYTSRDFTFVENAVQANIKALLLPELGRYEVLNVACGDQVNLNDVVNILQEISGKKHTPVYRAEREGDVRHSIASIEKISNLLGYKPMFRFREGLNMVYRYYAGQ